MGCVVGAGKAPFQRQVAQTGITQAGLRHGEHAEVTSTLHAREIGFRSLTESIDTTTSGGRLIFHIFGALGQFERDLIRERTNAGLSAAAARGRKGGRNPVVTAAKLQRAQEHIANRLNVREAAVRLKIGKTALYVALQAAGATES